MASSETRAHGTVTKFLNVFEREGGKFKMLDWLADDPDMMREVVRIANSRLLEYVAAQAIKYTSPYRYNPAECFSPGEHEGVRIASVADGHFIVDEQREVSEVFFSSYDLRRAALLRHAYGEMSRMKLRHKASIDHLWLALRFHKQGRDSGAFMAMDGKWNFFQLSLCSNGHTQVVARLDEEGWHLKTILSVTPEMDAARGTRFIMDDAG